MKTAAFAILFSTVVMAQQGAQPAAPPPAEKPILVGTHVGQAPSAYDDGGRRDPFGSLVAPKQLSVTRGVDTAHPRPGLADLSLADVTVRGIVKSGNVVLAILEAPSKQSFVAHPKDRLLDASVQSIDDGGVVFTEQAGPGGPQNRIRKALRAASSEESQ